MATLGLWISSLMLLFDCYFTFIQGVRKDRKLTPPLVKGHRDNQWQRLIYHKISEINARKKLKLNDTSHQMPVTCDNSSIVHLEEDSSHLESKMRVKRNEIRSRDSDLCVAKFICRVCAKPSRYGFSWDQVKRFYYQRRPFPVDSGLYKYAALFGFKYRSLYRCAWKFCNCRLVDSDLIHRFRFMVD